MTSQREHSPRPCSTRGPGENGHLEQPRTATHLRSSGLRALTSQSSGAVQGRGAAPPGDPGQRVSPAHAGRPCRAGEGAVPGATATRSCAFARSGAAPAVEAAPSVPGPAPQRGWAEGRLRLRAHAGRFRHRVSAGPLIEAAKQTRDRRGFVFRTFGAVSRAEVPHTQMPVEAETRPPPAHARSPSPR